MGELLFTVYKDICNIGTAQFLCESESMYKGITEFSTVDTF